ncbi:MAG TPA: hypothetical protein VLE73_05805 [Candidatus Saccharimonadales bacterium]|nr:hypothetical protein [Candidatus Saccharimonadales bacterium]
MIGYVQRVLGISSFDRTLFIRLLTPSWRGGCTYVFVSLAVVGSLVVAAHLDNALISQTVSSWRGSTAQPANADAYSANPGAPTLLDETLQASLTVVITVSLIVLFCFCARAVIDNLHGNKRIHTRDPIQSQPLHAATTTFIHFVVRGTVLCLLLAGFAIFIKLVLIYVLAASYTDAPWPQSIAAVLTALAVLIVGMHIIVVLLRLLFLKPRLFPTPND